MISDPSAGVPVASARLSQTPCTDLRIGDYVRLYDAQTRTPGTGALLGYHRVERIESLQMTHCDGAFPLLAIDQVFAVFCQGCVAPVVLHAGSHRSISAVEIDRIAPGRSAHDRSCASWSGTQPPLFRPGTAPVPALGEAREFGTVGWEPSHPPPRRAAHRFAKPAATLLAGDYLELATGWYDDHKRGPDEGCLRVEHVRVVDPVRAQPLLHNAEWGAAGIVLVWLSGMHGGVVVLRADQDIRVLTAPLPGRCAEDRREPWHKNASTDQLPADILLWGRRRSPAEQTAAVAVDTSRRPIPPADEADLYRVEDPRSEEDRQLQLTGVDGLYLAPIDTLPWPHSPGKCDYAERVAANRATYPSGDGSAQAASAETYAQLSDDERAACYYHQANWPLIADMAKATVERAYSRPGSASDVDGPSDDIDTRLLDAASELVDEARQNNQALTKLDIGWLDSLIRDPILVNSNLTALANGQHRLCAIRASGAVHCPVDGFHLPDQQLAAPVLTADEHAAHTVISFGTQHLVSLGMPPDSVSNFAAALARHPHLRRHV